jgi:hypothetical protein
MIIELTHVLEKNRVLVKEETRHERGTLQNLESTARANLDEGKPPLSKIRDNLGPGG